MFSADSSTLPFSLSGTFCKQKTKYKLTLNRSYNHRAKTNLQIKTTRNSKASEMPIKNISLCDGCCFAATTSPPTGTTSTCKMPTHPRPLTSPTSFPLNSRDPFVRPQAPAPLDCTRQEGCIVCPAASFVSTQWRGEQCSIELCFPFLWPLRLPHHLLPPPPTPAPAGAVWTQPKTIKGIEDLPVSKARLSLQGQVLL